MRLREMNQADTGAVARLLAMLARQYFLGTCSPEQASSFLRENDEPSLRRLLGEGYVYHVADIDGEIAGFIGMRDQRHVYHLFVAARFQRRGIARTLWERAKAVAMADADDACFTVNASNYAVPLYESLGFVRTAPPQCKNGLEYNPMSLTVSAQPLVGAA